MSDPRQTRVGLLYGLAAYGWWGFVAIYFKAVSHVAPSEVLAHRVIWSAVLLGALVGARGRLGDAAISLRSRRTAGALLLSTTLIAVNWFTFIFAVDEGRVIEASLGYFINPLVNVALGVAFLGERLRRAQVWALLLATSAVVWLTLQQGELPWISLVLALSFGFYGLLRKRIATDALTGLTVEILTLLPLAILWLGHLGARDQLAFGNVGLSTDVLLIAGGMVTALPLLWFANAARRLPYSTVGFLQYIAPSLQFLIAVLLFGEHLGWNRLLAFGLIWIALGVFSADLLRQMRKTRKGR